MTIRPPWHKLFRKRTAGVDYTVSPVHEVDDDVDEGDDGTQAPVAEVLATGITDEYPTSEIIYTEEGDLVMAVTV